ncbi:hypothetical protein [Actinoplanes sp. NPDC049681]|uniref:hypothetical protein n=1 Tax=Actinoplanes sp. NPDC049681 TaxID=3363905 RepID=UPI0037A2A090
MTRIFTTAGTRIGIVTLAACGAFAVPASIAASAAPRAAAPGVASVVTAAADDCSSIQASIDALEVRVLVLQERLSEAGPAQKPGIIAQIRKLEAQIAQLQRDLATCTD